MQEGRKKDRIDELFAEGTPIDAALQRAVRKALWQHKQLGNPICTWRDGQVVWIPPEEIPVERPID
jgi:hypothetical protein